MRSWVGASPVAVVLAAAAVPVAGASQLIDRNATCSRGARSTRSATLSAGPISTLAPVEETSAEQRALFRRWPSGVCVVAAEHEGRRAAITVSALVSLSLEPALVGISLARVASLYEPLRDAGEWAVSILAGDQDKLAQRFALSLPPLALWDGVPVRDDDPRLIAGAVGWIGARTVGSADAGDHTFFVGEVEWLAQGGAASSLVYLHSGYSAL